MKKEDVILCRCEDVTLKQLHDCFDEGYTTFEEVKRILRIGMGPCQASTCSLLVQREIAKYTKQPLDKVKTHVIRPLITGVPLGSIAKEAKDES